LCFERVDNLGSVQHSVGDRSSHPICLHQQSSLCALNPFHLTRFLLVLLLTRRSLMGQLDAL
jgi:hypothetical protein